MSRNARKYGAALSAVLLLSACSSSSTGSTSTTSPDATSPAHQATIAHVATTSAHSAVPAPKKVSRSAITLAGSWSGRYSGAFQGTFTLTWKQSDGNLSGTIHLSDPGNTLALHGSVHGRVITFGTVGSLGITYSGVAAGDSMSGHYQVQGGSGSATGQWSATRS